MRNPRLGGLRTTFVVVAIIQEVWDGREVEDAVWSDLSGNDIRCCLPLRVGCKKQSNKEIG